MLDFCEDVHHVIGPRADKEPGAGGKLGPCDSGYNPRLLENMWRMVFGRPLDPFSGDDLGGYWVAVKELDLRYPNPKTVLFTMYHPYYGNLVYIYISIIWQLNISSILW